MTARLFTILILIQACNAGHPAPDLPTSQDAWPDTAEDTFAPPDTFDTVEPTDTPDLPPPPEPALCVNPASVKFGGKKTAELATLPLQLTSCSDAPLELFDIHFTIDSSPDFSLDLTTLSHTPTPENPLVIPAGEDVTVNVQFIPDVENPTDQYGNRIPDLGHLMIQCDQPVGKKEILVSGAGASGCCPTAVIQCAEGDEVGPQTLLHLFGDQSYAATGYITKWEWTVDQPPGSKSVFVPSSSFPNPTFQVNVAGKYQFHLTIYDQQNIPSCAPDTYEVGVIPCEAIHVELLWHTPEDPDETDDGPQAGSDLDLHFLHPNAGGTDLDGDELPDGWFDLIYDCFWFNSHPYMWGSFDPSIDDDPGLDRDDTDGAGPENINLNIPENETYRVGVHYWNEHGYGASYATVRVYFHGNLAAEFADVKLVEFDMWEVCTIDWPSGQVTAVVDEFGQHKITPEYENPLLAD